MNFVIEILEDKPEEIIYLRNWCKSFWMCRKFFINGDLQWMKDVDKCY